MDSCNNTLADWAMERVNNPKHYSGYSHIFVTGITPEGAEGVLDVAEENLNSQGTVHGGCLATLADTVAGVAVVGLGIRCVTSSSTLNYLRPAVGPKIFCRAIPEKKGKTILVYRVELTGGDGALVAVGTFNFCALGLFRPEDYETPKVGKD